MNNRKQIFWGLATLLGLILACGPAASQQIDPAALNTAVAQTAQAQFVQMTLQAQAASPAPTQPPPTVPPPTVPPPTVPPPTQPPSDEDLIRQALLVKLGWSDPELDFSLSQNTGQHAQGALKKVNEAGGAAWFAAKVNGQWVIAYIGQGIPYCSEVDPYTIPIAWISHCLDANGNTIERGAGAPPPQQDVFAPDPLGPAWSGMAFSSGTCYDMDVLFTATGAAVDVCLNNGLLTPQNGATFSGYADLSPPSLNTCKGKALSADPIAPNSDLYMCFQTNLGSYGFFVMRDDQQLSSGYIVFDAYVFP